MALVIAGTFVISSVASRPIGVTITDEVRYLTEAQAIAKHMALKEAASYLPSEGTPQPIYPIGWPFVLAPTTSLGEWAPFSLPILIHLIGAALFATVLQRRGLSAWWALLYFAQPAQLLFSRTLMAETIASLWTVALILAADRGSPGGVGFLAASSAMLKPSLAMATVPFALAWVIFEIPKSERLQAFVRTALGALVPIACWIWLKHAGLTGTAGYRLYATATPSLRHVGLVLLTFLFAWPLLPLGAWRARPSERVGAAALLAVLIFYQYDYVGPSWAATLVVGSRLQLPAIVMLLPGYAIILASTATRFRSAMLAALVATGLTLPLTLMRTLATRRRVLDGVATATLAALRPGCLVGYTPFAVKLLVPYPHSISLYSVAEEQKLQAALLAGDCVDLIAPIAQLTTLEGDFSDPGFFKGLLHEFSHCALDVPGAARIIRVAQTTISCGSSEPDLK